MTRLVLAAHPDDEVLGCGGTIARYSRTDEVHIAILGEGVTSRYADPSDAPTEALKSLRRQSQQVGDLLGASRVHHFDLPDNRLDTIPLLEIIKKIEAIIDELEPQVVYTQHGGDLNVDHQRLFQATLTATRPTSDHPVRELYAYEVGSSSEWSFQQFAPRFQPDHFVDITDTLDLRLKAMELYESESRSFPHPRSVESQEAIARRWGSVVGCAAAEAFETIRRIET